jgi:hypothetical protein
MAARSWLDADDVRRLLARRIFDEAAGNRAAWAKNHGLSGAYVNDVLNGQRDPGKKILNVLGLEVVRHYRWGRPETSRRAKGFNAAPSGAADGSALA